VNALAASAPPAVRFSIAGVDALHESALPTLRMRLRAEPPAGATILGLALAVRVRIAADRRRYDDAERERLGELFGAPEQWTRSLGGVPWTEASVNVPRFTSPATIDVPLPCTYDFEVASAKYLAALGDGAIPVDVLLTGTMYYAADDGRLQAVRLPWDTDLTTRVPVATWRAAIDAAFPDAAWLRLRRGTFAALQAYRSRHAFTSWEETFASLLREGRA